jgi:hypothetical protein
MSTQQTQPPSGNGKAEQPDLRNLIHPKRAGGSDHKGVFDEFLTSNKNNPTKSRIPHAAGMAVYQGIGLWGSTSNVFSYFVQGKQQYFRRDVAGLHDLFKQLYDEDAISLKGESRKEAQIAALGYFLQDIEQVTNAQNRLGEKGGASKSK